jgi:hypothetical protein
VVFLVVLHEGFTLFRMIVILINNSFYSRLTTGLLLMLLAAESKGAVQRHKLPVKARSNDEFELYRRSLVGTKIAAISGFIDAYGDERVAPPIGGHRCA